MFNRVHHPGYLVEDLERAIEWYEKTFEGKVLARGLPRNGRRSAFVQIGNTIVELTQPADASTIAGKGGQVLDHIGYEVEDIEKAMAEFKAKGMRFTTEAPTTNSIGCKLIYFDPADTQGTRVHIIQTERVNR